MWTVKCGQIGAPGEPSTTELGSYAVESRSAAEAVAVGFLVGRGVEGDTAAMMARHADWGWMDDFPTRSAIRIFET